MKPKKPENKSHKKGVPHPKTAKELAGAMFFLADKRLPADRRRFTKSARIQHKSIEPEQGGN